MSFWILQTNPKLYDIDAALQHRPIIYWRIPQYTDQVKQGDLALIWRAGQHAGFVGWGVFYTAPARYDLSATPDPFWKGGLAGNPNEYHAPVRVWPGDHIAKSDVAAHLPNHRIVTAPMGTVFSLNSDDLVALQPLLHAHGYDLERLPEEGFVPPPVLALPEPEPKPKDVVEPTSAEITPALFLLSSTPAHPVEITIEGDALRLLLLEREALDSLDESWDMAGIYLLIGNPTSEGAKLSIYVGKAQALRSRVKTHTLRKWSRCLLVKREGLQAFNASDISWLERRLIDVLVEAPEVQLINKTPPPPEIVPNWKAKILERTVLATLGVLAVLGAYVA